MGIMKQRRRHRDLDIRTLPLVFAMFAALQWPALGQAQTAEEKPASDFTRQKAEEIRNAYPFADKQDFDFAQRGFIAPPLQPQVRDADGKTVRDYSGWEMFKGTGPDTVNPSLWRESQLMARAGLFKVTEGVYQVRGMDLANMSVIVGKTGYILVDPLFNTETAKAALELVKAKLGDKPVKAVIITHSHVDHYGGIKGIVDERDVADGRVQVIAPEHFIQEIVGENVIAGPAMARRTAMAFGNELPLGPTGSVSYGLGPAYKTGIGPGTITQIAPTLSIKQTGEKHVVDGIEIEFMMTPDAEAPAEFVFFIPQYRALCGAEVTTGTIHNVLTLRGALVRNAKTWADDLTEMLARYGAKSDVIFSSHFWPRFGNDAVVTYLSNYRDAYKYLHDQTVRMMNNGMLPEEIAETIKLPAALDKNWYNHGYYGTLSHNSKAIYQRYLGWYQGNPADLNPLPPVETAQHWIAALGGADRALELGKVALAKGEYRWAGQLLKQVVFADPTNRPAKLLLADAMEQMGYQAESAMWRSVYLSGASELRNGVLAKWSAAGTLGNLPFNDLLDMVAVRLDPALAKGRTWTIAMTDSQQGVRQIVTVRNDVLVHVVGDDPAGIEISGDTGALAAFLTGADADALITQGKIAIKGDLAAVKDFQRIVPRPSGNFNIVEP